MKPPTKRVMTGMRKPAAAWRNAVRQLARDPKAAVSIEYALIASLVSVAILGGVTALRDEIAELYKFVEERVVNADDSSDPGNGESTD